MSMPPAQCDELRTMAAMLVVKGLPEVASVVRDAADTIWQLREDLRWTSKRLQETEHEESRAWDRVHKAESQVARLRELAARAWILLIEHGAFHQCDMPEVDAVRDGLRELGIEAIE